MNNKSNSELQITEVQVYKFHDKKCEKLTGTKWFIVEQSGTLFLKEKKNHIFMLDKQIIKVVYGQEQAYYFKLGDEYITFIFKSKNQEKDLVQYKLQENGLKVIQWVILRVNAKENMKNICGDIQKSPSVKIKTKFQSISYQIGGFFGAMNNLIAKPSTKINQQANKKVQEIKEQNISEQNKNNWQLFKTKAKQLNKGAAQLIKPASEKVSSLATTITEKFQNSDNSVIKGIRNYGNSFKNSINDGYKNFRKTQEQEIKLKQKNTPESQREME